MRSSRRRLPTVLVSERRSNRRASQEARELRRFDLLSNMVGLHGRLASEKGETMTSIDQLTTDTMRYIFLERPRCPVCDSCDLQTLRSQRQSDGSTKRRTQCKTCRHKFFIILE